MRSRRTAGLCLLLVLLVWAMMMGLNGLPEGLSPTNHPVPAEPESSSPALTAIPAEPMRADSHGDTLPEGAIGRLGTNRFRHGGRISSIAFSPDGKWLATAGGGVARIWESATGKELYNIRIFEFRYATTITFSPDGRVLAVLGDRAAMFLWEPERRLLCHFELPKKSKCMAFSPDGSMVLIGGEDGLVSVWNPTTGRELRRLANHIGPVKAVAWYPDGTTVLSFDHHSLHVSDRKSGKLLCQVERKYDEYSAVFSRDGKLLAVDSRHQTLDIFDTASGKCLRSLNASEHLLHHVTFSPDGKTLLGGDQYGRVLSWDVETGEETSILKDRNPDGLSPLTVSPDGQSLAIAVGGTVRIVRTAGGELRDGAGSLLAVKRIGYCSHGEWVASASKDRINLWNVKQERIVGVLDDRSAISGLVCSADGKRIAAWGWERLEPNRGNLKDSRWFRVWTIGPDEVSPPVSFPVHPDSWGRLSPDWTVAVEAGERFGHRDGALGFLDVATGRELSIAPFPVSLQGADYVFSSDGVTVAVLYPYNGIVRLWNMRTAEEHGSFQLRSNSAFRLITGTPDEKTFAIAGSGEPIELWDARLLKKRGVVPDSRTGLRCLAFAPNGRLLAVGDSEGVVYLWDIVIGQRRRLDGHRGAVHILAFSPDGKTLATAGEDTTILLWDMTIPMPTVPTEWPSHESLLNLWGSLNDADAEQGFQAIRFLASYPDQALPFLRECCQPGQAIEPGLLQAIADLDDDEFDVRNRAMRKLERLGSHAEPALRVALTQAPSLEQRRRMVELLEKLDAPMPTERLRASRVVETLERIDSPESLQLLREVAQGSPLPWLSLESQNALARRAQSWHSGQPIAPHH